jgi:putative ABC transport system ATP-binding protein
VSRDKAEARAKELLGSLGLEERWDHRPAQLSGGEQQRVAIARALAKNPSLLLCDEPTGALDYQTGKAVLATLIDVCRKAQNTLIIVTHNSALAPVGDLLLRMRSGKLVEMKRNETPLPVSGIEW